MKIAIVGSRSFNDYAILENWILSHTADETISLVISGGAMGADRLAERFAFNHNIPMKVIIPNWDQDGRTAGVQRSIKIIKEADVCFVFWDGLSRGTRYSIELCQRYGKPTYICRF